MDTTSLLIERETILSAAFPKRGMVVAGIAVGLGLCLVRPIGGSIAWADVAVLASLAVASIVGANEARRLVRQRQIEAEVVESIVEPQWMTVIVQAGGPAETAGALVVPKAPPRKDPERRALARRAKERKTMAASHR